MTATLSLQELDESRSQTSGTQELLETVVVKLDHLVESNAAIIATQRAHATHLASIYQEVRALKAHDKVAELLLTKEEEIARLRQEIVELRASEEPR